MTQGSMWQHRSSLSLSISLSRSKSALRPPVLNTFHLEMCFPPQQRALFRYRNFQKFQKLFETVSCSHFSVANVLCATAACTFSRPELPKVARDRQFLTLLTSECASRHNAVHFFDISTSKSAPRPLVFNTFHLETCFAPQWPAFFQHHLKFQNCSDNGVFCTFWLRRVLLATIPRTFCASQLPKVLRAWCALSILASKCASCHNIAPFQQLNFQKCSEPAVFLPFSLPNALRATTACNFWSHLPR